MSCSGEDFLRKNLLFAAGAMAAAGPGGIATLGMANAMMWSRNLFQVMTNNPISAQPVIDAGVAYVRNHPKSKTPAKSTKCSPTLTKSAACSTKRSPTMSWPARRKKKSTRSKTKLPRALLNAASKSSSRSSQENYLQGVLDYHPDSQRRRRSDQETRRARQR